MTIDAIYTAESTATGGGRDGHVKSSDGKLNLDTRPPKEMGGSGDGVNPELLFSAGYAACFLGALRLVAKNSGVTLDDATAVTVRIGIGKDATSYGLTSDFRLQKTISSTPRAMLSTPMMNTVPTPASEPPLP
jgi:osmotically inducible protein OsmC